MALKDHEIGLSTQSYLEYLKEYVQKLKNKQGQTRGDRVVIDLLTDYIKNRESTNHSHTI